MFINGLVTLYANYGPAACAINGPIIVNLDLYFLFGLSCVLKPPVITAE